MMRLTCLVLIIAALSVEGTLVKQPLKQYKVPEVPNQHSLTTVPINEAVMLGSTIVFPCAVADPATSRLQWIEFATTGQGQVISDNDIVLPGHPNYARYSIIQATQNDFYLQIANVTMGDGGSYVCMDANSGPPEVYSWQIELVVLAADPNCTTIVGENGIVMEGQNYSSSCQIFYQGNLSPAMYWEGPPPFTVAEIVNQEDVYSGILFTVDRSMDTRAHRCITNFTALQGVPGGVADNVPDYSHVSQFQQLYVYWGPKNMYAVPIKPTYEVGDLITCYADAFPDPFYEWYAMCTLETQSSQVFNVTPNLVGLNCTLRCQAQNLIQGFIYSANLFVQAYVPAPTTPPSTTPTTTTTPPPAEANCDNLTGWWLAEDPYAEMHLDVFEDGKVFGYMRNGTDQQWVELVGRARTSDWLFLGLTAIWPYETGITGQAAECHKCFGTEVMLSSGQMRSFYESQLCGNGGTPRPYTAYQFSRVPETQAASRHLLLPKKLY